MNRYSTSLHIDLEDDTSVSITAETVGESEKDAEAKIQKFMDAAQSGKVKHTSLGYVREVPEPEDFYDYARRAKEELHQRVDDMNDEEKAEFYEDENEVLTEIADGLVPIYNQSLFEVAASNSDCWEDQDGLAGGSSDVCDILRAAIFSALRNELYEEFEGMKNEYEESKEEENDEEKA